MIVFVIKFIILIIINYQVFLSESRKEFIGLTLFKLYLLFLIDYHG